MAPAIRVSEIMHALFADCRGVIELRAFDASGFQGRLFAPLEDVDRLQAFWREHQSHNLYWGVSTRRDESNGSLANCLELPALFADCDFKMSSEAAVRERLAACPLAPSLTIASGGGLQPYWLLKEPADVGTDAEHLRDVLRRLAAYLGADVVAGEPARILRIPGSTNIKYTPPRVVRVEQFSPERRYNLSDFDWLPTMPLQANTSRDIDLSKPVNGERNASLYKIGRGLKAKGIAPVMVSEALRFLNTKCCQPPLEAWEVEQIIAHVLQQPDRPGSGASRRISCEVST